MTNPSNAQGTNPPEPPDDLRDARLVRALQHMPDAHMQPNAQTRQAVLQEALRAAAPPPTAVSRWLHAWMGQPGHRVPWSAAMASVAIASFITVLWYGQEVPDAAPERGPVVQREEATTGTGNDHGGKGASQGAIKDKDTAETTSGPNIRTDADTQATRSGGPLGALGKESMKERAVPSIAAPRAPAAVAEADRRAPAPPTAAAAPRAAPLEREMAQKVAPAAAAPVTMPAAPVVTEALASGAANSATSAAELRADSTRAAPPASPAPALAGGLDKAQANANANASSLPQRSSIASAFAPADARAGVSADANAGAGARAESKASPALTISMGDVKRSFRPEQAQALLNRLRGLPYGPVLIPPSDLRSGGASVLSKRTEPDTDLLVELAGQERWVIAPGQVILQTGTTRVQSDITPAQYATLRRLAMELKVQP